MFHAFKFPWPAAVASVFDAASLSTASIDLTAPQCTINLSYSSKWIATQVLPVALVGASVLLLGASVLLRSCRAAAGARRRSIAGLLSSVVASFVSGVADATDVAVGAIFTILYFTFFITTQVCACVRVCVCACVIYICLCVCVRISGFARLCGCASVLA